jgi:protein O-GlcNAc transferase
MRILFICFSTLKFDVLTPYAEPLGGTESAICYLSVALAARKHEVFVMRNVDGDDTGMVIEGVTHLKMSEDIARLEPDVVIMTSAPMAAPGIKKIVPGAKVILWNHMRPDQPAMNYLFQEEYRSKLDGIVYVSGSQKDAFTAINPNLDGMVLGNAISPAFESLFHSARSILDIKECRGAYTSTPYRGASVLAEIKEIPIDVYSSMKVYQGDDSSYDKMFDALRSNDCLTLHPSFGQRLVAARLRPVAFMVYPSIFTECHSIAIIEAMAAGLKVITTDMAHEQTEFVDSLPAKNASLDDYTKLLRKNVNYFRAYPEEFAEKMWKQVQYINSVFTWRTRAHQWEVYLQNLLNHPISLTPTQE